MKLTDTIRLYVTPQSNYELDFDREPRRNWFPTGDGRYYLDDRVKNIIGITIFMKQKAITQYTVGVFSNNNAWGTVSKDPTHNPDLHPVGERVRIIPNPKSGYIFTQWNDGNKENPREIVVNGNMNSQLCAGTNNLHNPRCY